MLSPVSLCQVASPLYVWTELKLMEKNSKNCFSPRNLKLRLFRQEILLGLWLGGHSSLSPRGARAGVHKQDREAQIPLTQGMGWGDRLEQQPSSWEGAGTRGKDIATEAPSQGRRRKIQGQDKESNQKSLHCCGRIATVPEFQQCHPGLILIVSESSWSYHVL